MRITSVQNEKVKAARALRMKKAREAEGLHFIEGWRMLEEAVQARLPMEAVFVEEGQEAAGEALLRGAAPLWSVTRAVMESLCDTRTPQGICASVKTPAFVSPAALGGGLIVALDAVQEPGNLGTIIRSADALGASGIFLGAGCADPYAPKTLRSGMGSMYHLPMAAGGLCAALQSWKERGFRLLCAHLQGGEMPQRVGMDCVLVIGNEGRGVSAEAAALCDCFRLYTPGRAESLNASVAAGICIYELLRRMDA